jgi:hypothetical protein
MDEVAERPARITGSEAVDDSAETPAANASTVRATADIGIGG